METLTDDELAEILYAMHEGIKCYDTGNFYIGMWDRDSLASAMKKFLAEAYSRDLPDVVHLPKPGNL